MMKDKTEDLSQARHFCGWSSSTAVLVSRAFTRGDPTFEPQVSKDEISGSTWAGVTLETKTAVLGDHNLILQNLKG